MMDNTVWLVLREELGSELALRYVWQHGGRRQYWPSEDEGWPPHLRWLEREVGWLRVCALCTAFHGWVYVPKGPAIRHRVGLARQMRARGKSLRKIAAVLGMSPRWVARVTRKKI